MKSSLAALVVAVVAVSPPLGAQDTSSIGYATVAEALEALRADPAARISEQGGWTIVEQEVEDERILWSFTPNTHPAHPAAIKRRLFEMDGSLHLDMSALCQARKRDCDRLIDEFKVLNERIRRDMQGGR